MSNNAQREDERSATVSDIPSARSSTFRRIFPVPLVAGLLVCASLFMTGCQVMTGIILEPVVRAVIETPGQLHAQSLYKAHYANTAHAAINRGSSGRVEFLCVDGQDTDPAGNWYLDYSPIYVSPGVHRVAVKYQTGFTAPPAYSELELTIIDRHVYRIDARKAADETVLQVWDQTVDAIKPTLVENIRRFPVVHDIDTLLLSHKTDSAVITGDRPVRYYFTAAQPVFFISLDGRALGVPRNHYANPASDRLYLPAGLHHVVVVTRGGYMGLTSHLSPAVEIGVVAHHIYRFTAKRTDDLVLLQLWDETEGTDQHTLLQEVPLRDAKS